MTEHRGYPYERNRDFQEILQDMLKILKRKYPNPVDSGELRNKANPPRNTADNILSYAEEKGLIIVSSRKKRTRETKTYLITDKGLRLTEAWSRYKRDLRTLGLEDMIVSEV